VRLTVVGCSGSVPGPGSAASCYLLSADDGDGRTWRVLLDLGSGAFGPLQAHLPGGDPGALDAVWLSHLHADHCLDTTALYVALRYGPGAPAPRVPLWGPRGTAGRLARAYDLPEDPGMAAELDVRTWVEGEPVRVGPLTATPHRVLHPVEAYGLRVEGPAEDGGTAVVAYTGDTDDCPALDDLGRDADLLLCEATFLEGAVDVRGLHLSGARAGRAAARAGARRLVLTHVPPWTDAGAVRAEASDEYAGPLELAVPGAVLRV
jgi:ribonuclease BN (tRNA processing enzyme)